MFVTIVGLAMRQCDEEILCFFPLFFEFEVLFFSSYFFKSSELLVGIEFVRQCWLNFFYSISFESAISFIC